VRHGLAHWLNVERLLEAYSGQFLIDRGDNINTSTKYFYHCLVVLNHALMNASIYFVTHICVFPSPADDLAVYVKNAGVYNDCTSVHCT